MSLSRISYVGPYLLCKVDKIKKHEIVRVCSEEDCPRHWRHIWNEQTRFCIACGSEIVYRSLVYDGDSVSASEAVATIGEALIEVSDYLGEDAPEGCHVYLPNRDVLGIDREARLESSSDAVFRAIGPADVERELRTFRETLAVEIETLRTTYGGEGAVSFGWGVVSYCM